MGKNQRVRKEKKLEDEKRIKAEIHERRNQGQFWQRFWARPAFWIYMVCFLAVIGYPILGQYMKIAELKTRDEAVIHTSMGDITIKLYNADAPNTADNFIALARKNYYNGTTFQRVIKSFMIQGGDPKGDGTGGESANGGYINDEINAAYLGLDQIKVSNASFLQGLYDESELTAAADQTLKQFYESKGYVYDDVLQSHKMTAGSIAMANSGPNTNGSQFFIVTEGDQPHLDGKHTVFGEVTSGLDVAVKISEVEVDKDSKPTNPVTINSIEIR